MREILFRGKRKNNNEWIEGFVFDDDTVENPKMFIGSLVIEPYKGLADDKWDITGVAFDEVNPETIGQFTGLLDKNGKKIFEGDIVKCYSITVSGMEEEEFISDVFWLDCMWMLHEGEHCDSMLCYYDMSCEWGSHAPKIEVIGNIFDNPELLER